MDGTLLLPGCPLGPPGLLMGCAGQPSMDQGPSGKTGFSVKTGEKRRPVGFPGGHGESSGAPLRSARHLLGRARRRRPPIRWALLGRCCSLVLPTRLRSVSRRDRCVPGPHVRSTWLHARTSRCSVKPVVPPGWFQSCRSGAQEGNPGSGPPCLATTGCFRRPPSRGSQPWSCLTASRARSSLLVWGASVPFPRKSWRDLPLCPGEHYCPSAALTEHLPRAETALPGAGCGHAGRGLTRQVWVPAQPLRTARGGDVWESWEGQ